MNSLKPLLLCLATLNLTACQSHAASGGTSRDPLAQWSGAFGRVTTAATRTLQTAGAWDAFWKDAQREQPRALNPAQEMAVAIFLGERRTGGYTVEIVSAGAKDGKFVVEYRELTPAPDMMVTQALTQPWVVAIVPRTDLPVVFQKLPSAPQPRRE